MQTEVVEYSVTDAAIAKMSADYMGLTVNGLDDKAGLAMVHSARMVVKGKRLEVEKKRKELKADALAWSQKVDSEARRITALLAPIEDHLETEEGKITAEKARLKAEDERKKQERAQARVDALARLGVSLPFLQAMEISEGDYQARLIIAEDEHKKEQERVAGLKRFEEERAAAERKVREEEAARLAAERAELDRIRAEEDAKRKEQEAILRAEREALEAKRREEEARARVEREAIEAERRKVEDARREQERKEAIAKAEKEAAERAIREEKERIEREAREKAEAEAAAKAEAERQDALRPDKERLIAFAVALVSLPSPGTFHPAADAIINEAHKRIMSVNRYILKAAQEL
jgi:colicin import membrane protein